MIDVDVIDRLAVLAAITPFDRLTPRELLLVAGHVRPRDFDSGALLVEAGQAADLLYVTADGWAMAGNDRAPALFDVPSLLFTLPAPCDYRAGTAGLRALCLAKPHLFTIARECPDFVAGLIAIEALPR